ncbi:MAG TPA: RHS repeat-associated core domain-containing protein [Streptosporangiaceae bacterium]
MTDGAGNKTSYGYDAAGDQTSVTYPGGTQTSYSFDGAGRQTGQADLSATGAVLRSESAAYDGDGNPTSSTDFRGDTTTYAYDATGLLTSQTQPVSATSQITTSFGYDAAGNRTLYTDGNGNNWWTTYNSWNLPESRVEPATSAYSSAADSTFTTAYDADGRPVSVTEPGGVTVSNSYDNMGDLTGQSGSGADAPTAARTFGYDLAGDLTSASTTAAGSQPTTAESFSYDDRGLLLSASGSAGSSSFAYNGDGQVSSATSPAGTASYTYDNAGRLASMTDPVTGDTLSYGYTPLSQVSQISYGTGADTRAFGYNALHQLTSDTLTTSSGATVASISYGYDPNGNLTSKTTTGFAGASSNTYSYDEANRLTSWDNGSTTVDYTYDGAGNRTSAGGTTYTYDARDELTSAASPAGSTSYSYTARGTMASQSGPSGSATLTSDAYGQAAGTPGGQAEGYDALGRLLADTGSSGSHTLSYLGTSGQVTADGTSTYSWDPAGNLTGISTAGSGVLAWTDAHTDLVGAFTATATALSGSAAYDPWGTVTAASARPLPGTLGFQSEYTGTGSGLVHMGARWYNPASGAFTSRDTAVVDPAPDPAAANPFAYAGDNPLDGTDPSGNLMICNGSTCGSIQYFENQRPLTSTQVNAINSYGASLSRAPAPAPAPGCGFLGVGCAWHAAASGFDTVRHTVAAGADDLYYKYIRPATSYAYEGARALLSRAGRAIRVAAHTVADAAAWGYKVEISVIRDGWQAGSRAYHTVTTWAKAGYQTVTTAVKTTWHYVARAATATVSYVKHHAAVIGAVAASVAVFAGCEALTAGAGTIGCAAAAGAVGNAVSYAITAAQTGKFSWTGLAQSALTGAAAGALTAGLLEGAGALATGLAGTLLRSGADNTASALATSAADEAATATTESAATTADATSQTAAQDAAARAGTDTTGLSCGGLSFTAGTKVLTASGALVPISKLKTGQKVLATNTSTGKDQAGTIAAVLVHHDTDLYDLRVRTGGQTAVIDTTRSHLFWDQDTRRWVKAGALKYGTHLRTPAGGTATVLGGYTPRHHDGWMWDLTVTPSHDFYIDTADTAILVHNISGCDESPADAGPGEWGPGKNYGSPRARAYEEYVTGRPVGQSYYVNGVEFDGYSNGTLLDAKGPGYWKMIQASWSEEPAGLLGTAARQIAAAGGTPIEWHFAEEEAANFMRPLVPPGIRVIYNPMP